MIVSENLNQTAIDVDVAEPKRERTVRARSIDDRMRLQKLLTKQLRNFTVLFARVLAEDDADAVHDLRVATRRLQQILAALVVDKNLNKARSVRRTLRCVRRALGAWRSCDVALQWTARSERRSSNPTRKLGWKLMLDSVAGQRDDAIRSARRQMYKSGGITLNHRIQQLLAAAAARPDNVDSGDAVRTAVAAAAARWNEALERAKADRTVASIHALRIATKRLRYRVELARELGAEESPALIQWFKLLQDRLGHWHDRQELSRFITLALAGCDVMATQPRVAMELLREVERNLKISASEVEELFRLTGESEDSRRLTRWLQSNCAPAAADSVASANGAAAVTPTQPQDAVGEQSVNEHAQSPQEGEVRN
jgi:CHAD domain-containing protein